MMRITMDRRSLVGLAVRKAAAQGLTDGAEHLLEESNRIAPIEEGTLIRSGVASVDEQQLRAAVSYDTPYAVRQHEDTRLRHDSGRQAKFLEASAKRRAKAITGHVVAALKAASR